MMASPLPDSRRIGENETARIDEIAAWKAPHPSPSCEFACGAALPLVKVAEFLIPGRIARAAILAAYGTADMAANPHQVLARAGVGSLDELRGGSLEACDQLASRVGAAPWGISIVEGRS